jgi:cytochrome c oxidase cbb3-type subunit 3
MKFTARALLSLIPFTLLVGTLGCERKIGPPNDQDELMRPENVASFDRLYKQNCSACHGESGSGGPAFDLANPKYQAVVDDASLKRWITSGMPGTQMPAFGEPCSLQACVHDGVPKTTARSTCLRTLQTQWAMPNMDRRSSV